VRKTRCGVAVVVAVLCSLVAVRVHGASRPDLSGAWTLNRDFSEFPSEVGFDPDWHDSDTAGRTGTGRSGGGRGRGRGGGGSVSGGGSSRAGSVSTRFESEEDSRKIRELMNEVKEPSEHLTITQMDAAVTIVDARGGARTLHIGGKEDTVQLDAGPVGVITKWENAQLVSRLLVQRDRELRYRYSRDPVTRQLVVEVQFAEHGRGAVIKRIYD